MTGPKRSELDALREESELLDRIHHTAVVHSLIFTTDDEEEEDEEEGVSMSSAVSSLHGDTYNIRRSIDRGSSLSLPSRASQKDMKLTSLYHLEKPSIGDDQATLNDTIVNYNNSDDKTKDDPRLKEMRQTMIEYSEEVDNLNKDNVSLKETVVGLERVIANSDKRNTELQRLLDEAYKREREKDKEINTLKEHLQQAKMDISTHQTEASSLRLQVEELSPVVDVAHNSEAKEERLISLLCRYRVLLLRIQHRLAAQTRQFTTFLDKITDITRGICGANLGISVGLDDIQTEVSSIRKEMLEARVTLQQSHNEKLQSDEESIMSLSQRYAEEAASWQAERRQHLEAAVTWLAQKKAYEKKKATWKEERKKLMKEIADL
ncbi:hypothetical protein FOL47_005311 [Perkinsus chesapeaki]|uniref:Uncharacterized protein n=1 Tax=Perkinsus chesapeaki TaxID=330153 RepID=A0A7J6LZ01_PERCH|nr:hypothetical protein FOL47_005311 [Perkinsus chesapeaki]